MVVDAGSLAQCIPFIVYVGRAATVRGSDGQRRERLPGASKMPSTNRIDSGESSRTGGIDEAVDSAAPAVCPEKLFRSTPRLSTPVQNPTVPPVENPTDRRGDEPQFVVTS